MRKPIRLPTMRKPIQLTTAVETNGEVSIFALCDDGTIWHCEHSLYDYRNWTQIESIPQEEAVEVINDGIQ